MAWNIRNFAWKKYSNEPRKREILEQAMEMCGTVPLKDAKGKVIEREPTAEDIKNRLPNPITLNALEKHLRTMTIRDHIFEMDVFKKRAERGRPKKLYPLNPSLRDEYNSREQNASPSFDTILISEDEAKRRGSEFEKEKK